MNARRINTTARRARLPLREAKFAGGDQAAVRAEARFDVLDRVEWRDRIGARVVRAEDGVERVALGRHAAGVADPAVQLGRTHELTVLRAGRRGDRLVDQRAAEIVGAGVEQRLREFWSFLDPRGLDVAED